MIVRRDREDLSAQRQLLADTRAKLADCLDTLAYVATVEAKVTRRKTGNPDMAFVASAYAAAARAEQDVDIAVMDLQGASGEDL